MYSSVVRFGLPKALHCRQSLRRHSVADWISRCIINTVAGIIKGRNRKYLAAKVGYSMTSPSVAMTPETAPGSLALISLQHGSRSGLGIISLSNKGAVDFGP